MFATSDPLGISLYSTLAGVGLEWSKITTNDDADASYQNALHTLIFAGYVDAKIEMTVEMQGRLGVVRAIYHCHGGCDELLNQEAIRHAQQKQDWLNNEGKRAGPLVVMKHIRAVRLSAMSVDDLLLDRPNEKLAALPLIVENLKERMKEGEYCQPPSIELQTINMGALDGPDDQHEGVFYWQGEAHRLTKRNWQMLRAIYGHDAVSMVEVGELVWGSDEIADSTVRAQLNRLNRQMGELNLPLAWRIDGRQIVPEK